MRSNSYSEPGQKKHDWTLKPKSKQTKLFSCCAQRNWENHGQLYQGRHSWIPASSRIARLFSWRLKRGSVSAEEQTQWARKQEGSQHVKQNIQKWNICGIYLIHRDSYIWIPIWITIQHDLLTVSSTLPSHSRQVVYQTENFFRSFLTSPLLGSDTPGSVTQHSLVAMFPRYSQVRSSCSHSLEDNFFKKCQHVPSESNWW